MLQVPCIPAGTAQQHIRKAGLLCLGILLEKNHGNWTWEINGKALTRSSASPKCSRTSTITYCNTLSENSALQSTWVALRLTLSPGCKENTGWYRWFSFTAPRMLLCSLTGLNMQHLLQCSSGPFPYSSCLFELIFAGIMGTTTGHKHFLNCLCLCHNGSLLFC